MIRKILSTVFLSLFIPALLLAQGSITGVVTDANSGETLPGVNVVLLELQKGSATNSDGEYTITDVPPGTYTLSASFVGFKKFETQVEIGTGQVTRDIALQPDVLGMQEVVVNALGFQEDRDKQGVATSNVSGEDLENTGEDNAISALSAKAPGVSIISTSGDPGAAARIQIRGQVSLQGDNQPLFVIDGVPVYNTSIGNNQGGVSQQSRLNDLNPDNIESVEILKGPSAAALWGSRAANGVVVITTKSGGRTDGKVNITVQSEVTVDQLNRTVPLQTSYGQGLFGSGDHYAGLRSFLASLGGPGQAFEGYTESGYWWGYPLTWGDKIADRAGGEDEFYTQPGFTQMISQKNSRETWDHSDEIFDDGIRVDNSVAISGGDDMTSFYLNVSNLDQDGIIKTNSTYNRTNIRANVRKRYTEDLTVRVNSSYSHVTSDRIQRGSNVSGVLLGMYRTPPDFNNQPYLTTYVDENGNELEDRHRSFRNPDGRASSPGYDNPYFTINENTNVSEVQRLFGNTELTYDPTNWLSITHRLGIDYYTDSRKEVLVPNNASVPSGFVDKDDISQFQINSDLIARAARQLTQDISGSVLLGYNLNQRRFNSFSVSGSNFVLDDAPATVENLLSTTPNESESTERTSALYSEINIDAYDQLSLKLSGRSESASTYGQDIDNTYFYPSASLAWRFTNLEGFPAGDILSFGKLRASYGKAGVQPGPYNTKTTFFSASYGEGWGPQIDALNYGGGAARSFQQGNPRLKPEITEEFEVGLDLRFLDDRIGLGATWYKTDTEDAILGVDVPPSSGFSSRLENAATIENEGYELKLDVEWIRRADFSWTSSVNWSTNENEVTSLREGVDNIFLAGFFSASSRAVLGEPVSVIYGGKWRRASEEPISPSEETAGFTVGDNDLVLTPSGFPTSAAQQGVIGDANPDWRAGIQNTFKYKNISLSALLDIKHGGDMWNGTKGALYFFGVHGDQDWEATADQDISTFGGSTISNGTTFRGYVEDFGAGPVAIEESFFYSGPGSGFTGPAEPFIEDAGFVRLRQVSLSYRLNTQGFRDVTGLSSIDFAVTGRNLKLWTDYTGIDPETNLEGPQTGQGLDYFNNPNTRSFVFSLKVNY